MTTPVTTVAVVYHSGYGHTKVLAEAVASGVEADGTAKALLVSVDAFEDHGDALDAADAIIFGSPTYMGSVSGPFKMFMDATSGRWMGRKWSGKLAAGFTVSASRSGDKMGTLVQLSVFAAQHGMIWVGLDLLPGNNSSKGSESDLNRLGSFLGVMAQANADEGSDVAPPEADRRTAAVLGQRVAGLAGRWAAAQAA
ncbi:flavodoxin family protein [Novispirillum itersonii]|uniref:Multimeric flavodoxin WrbA n=1 Tax=Novispirillum itersonii TaxID=189 RepID=A0A7W9ZFA3_NOVIT|nr:flavodoxin family protein [Novispirillum itersonii]MBB6210431.1 multimeric flavodoxin WrbA [Novispirillum itersonii]